MPSILEELFRIKEFREQAAHTEVRKCHYQYEQAIKSLAQKQQERTAYTAWRLQEEDRLFAILQNKPVVLKEVDDFKQAVGLLRTQENMLEDQVKQARKDVDTATEALNKAKTAHAEAVRAKEKFAEYLSNWRETVLQEKEYQEEMELEEFSNKSIPSPDGDEEAGDDY